MPVRFVGAGGGVCLVMRHSSFGARDQGKRQSSSSSRIGACPRASLERKDSLPSSISFRQDHTDRPLARPHSERVRTVVVTLVVADTVLEAGHTSALAAAARMSTAAPLLDTSLVLVVVADTRAHMVDRSPAAATWTAALVSASCSATG
jgi:hypothetical protein